MFLAKGSFNRLAIKLDYNTLCICTFYLLKAKLFQFQAPVVQFNLS